MTHSRTHIASSTIHCRLVLSAAKPNRTDEQTDRLLGIATLSTNLPEQREINARAADSGTCRMLSTTMQSLLINSLSLLGEGRGEGKE